MWSNVIKMLIIKDIVTKCVAPLWWDPTKYGLEEDLSSPWIADVCVLAWVVPSICVITGLGTDIYKIYIFTIVSLLRLYLTHSLDTDIKVCIWITPVFMKHKYEYKRHTNTNTKCKQIQKKYKYQGVHPPVLSRPTPSLHSKVQPDCE